jgi:hypothetical protein
MKYMYIMGTAGLRTRAVRLHGSRLEGMYKLSMAKIIQEKDMRRVRLKIARLRRYPRKKDALVVWTAETGMSEDSYTSYEVGRRQPGIPALQVLERLFGVEPKGWLVHGAGESYQDLLAMLDEAEAQAAKATTAAREINPLTQYKVAKSSPEGSIRHISLLSAREIHQYLAGVWGNTEMSAPRLPIPSEVEAGPRAFGHVVPHHDLSMVSAGGISIPPGTILVVDPDQDVLSGNLMLIAPAGSEWWLLRQYEAALPLSIAAEFTLRASNPSIPPITVSDRGKWVIGGRLIYTMHRW